MDEGPLQDLRNELVRAYKARFPLSGQQHERSKTVMVDGGQHTLRLYEPYPLYVQGASGAYVVDLEGHRILDFWQGHFANILGHNPPLITEALVESLSNGYGLQTGMVDVLACELAELICQQTGAERVRFTTSGSLATMYSVMLSRSFTGRDLVLKVMPGERRIRSKIRSHGFHSLVCRVLGRDKAVRHTLRREYYRGMLEALESSRS